MIKRTLPPENDVPVIAHDNRVGVDFTDTNVIPFPGSWHGKFTPQAVKLYIAEKCKKGEVVGLVIVTEDNEGEVHVTSTSHRNEDVLWLLEQAKLHTLGVPEQDDEPDDITA